MTKSGWQKKALYKVKKEDLLNKKFETKAIHSGQEPDGITGSIMTPIHLSSTFVQTSPGQHTGYEYSRTANPTRTAYETCLAELEGGNRAFALASGCAATSLVLHRLKVGDEVIASDDMYGGTYRLFEKVFKNKGIKFHYVDLTSPESMKSVLSKNTQLVWVETPTNPTLKMIDIQRVKELLPRGVDLCVDNTFMSSYFQKPLLHGADLVVHSTTKFMNGHSDVVGGAVISSRKELSDELAFLANSVGNIAGAFDSYLVMRSLKTLPVRMERHQENAFGVSGFLESHPKIDKVIYPGLRNHPQYEIAEKQMTGFGGVISFILKGGLTEAKAFLESVRVFSLAESLGGVESLIEHPGIMTHASVPKEQRKQLGINDSFIRLSVGLENKDDLLADLRQALNRAFAL